MKSIETWTIGMMELPSETREKIEQQFNELAKTKDDWFYKVTVDNKDYFICDNGEFGYTAMLPGEY
jgi:hypothetical protein